MNKTVDVFEGPVDGHPDYALDAQTESCENRVIAFENSLELLMKDYQYWVTDHGFKEADIWYADIYGKTDGKERHIAALSIEEDGVSIRMEPVENSNRRLSFRRPPGIKRRIRNLKARAGRMAS